MKNIIRTFTAGANDLFLVVGVAGILVVLFTPVSSFVLDFLLLLNISLALLILLITFYTEKPLEFSTLPSLLLLSTLFRLSLNIAATRLILNEGDGGKVIGAVGEYVVAGNYVIGLVVFLILIVVQYVVVTNGAQRVAEVSARFILDSLPGKQMSVDADLNMGIITQEEAKARRSELEKESNFYGAMDGASKFVKGDAIAGIIIILIDIIGGLSIGLVQLDMAWPDALQRYTLLTVGDGIVTQIPSLIIAVSTGIIITRAATDTRLGVEIAKQFSMHPKTLVMVAIAMMCLAMVPSIPVMPIFILVLILCFLAWMAIRNKKRRESISDEGSVHEGVGFGDADEGLYASLTLSEFEISMGEKLYSHFKLLSEDLEKRLLLLRKNLAIEFGVILPNLKLKKDIKIGDMSYQIFVYGDRLAAGALKVDSVLAINGANSKVQLAGEATKEPTYNLPAIWIDPKSAKYAADMGYTIVEPDAVLLTHIQELCRSNASMFLTRKEVEKLIESRKGEIGSLLDDLIPNQLTYSDVQQVLKHLIDENVSIRNLQAIFDVLLDVSRNSKDPIQLADACREKLKSGICEKLSDGEGKIHVLTVNPALERRIMATLRQEGAGQVLSPQEFEPLIRQITIESEKMLVKNLNPVLLCAAPIRRYMKSAINRVLPQVNVLSVNEIDRKIQVVSSAVIELEGQ